MLVVNGAIPVKVLICVQQKIVTCETLTTPIYVVRARYLFVVVGYSDLGLKTANKVAAAVPEGHVLFENLKWCFATVRHIGKDLTARY